jgi:hypothetical protein
MKTVLKTFMTLKVHCFLFVLACLLLAGVAMAAKVIADEISADADRVMHQTNLPQPPSAPG